VVRMEVNSKARPRSELPTLSLCAQTDSILVG
jgi:hypothetical protein